MTPRHLRNIHSTGRSRRDALPSANMTPKLPQYFYLLIDGEGSWLLLPSLVSPYYQAAQCNQKTPIPICSRWQVRPEKAKKGQASALITATTSIHLSMPVSTDLTITPDSVLTNPTGKDGVWSWFMQNIYPIGHFYCGTITRRVDNQG